MVAKNYSNSARLLARAQKVLAGGVSSEFRKFNYPHALFYAHGKGSRITDVDGNEYIDFTLSQGPLILGHSHPKVMEQIATYSSEGQLFAGQHIKEVELAEKINELVPAAEMMRFCLDGSEAVHTALRLARAKTGKSKFLRFEGHYHGWLDNVSWGINTPSKEALGDRTNPVAYPWSEGLPESTREEFIVLPWNDLALLEQTIEKRKDEIAAVITEPVMCNNGCIPPERGFLEGLRKLTANNNIALIFDEVITGFRLSLGGAQQFFNVIPDMCILAKAIASGYPLSVIAGKKEWMHLLEEGKVIQAGTMNSGNSSVAAALATIMVLQEEAPYKRMSQLAQKLKKGLKELADIHHKNLLIQTIGPILHTGFTPLSKVKDFRDAISYDKKQLHEFIAGLQNRGIRVIGRGLWYISAVHTDDDIEEALRQADKVFQEMGK